MRKPLALLLALCLCMTIVSAESPEEQEKQPVGYVALTFDDGPSGEYTEALLDGLFQRNARATFFLCGYRMDRYPELLSRYETEGHEVGVHSTVHKDLTTLTPAEVRADMQDTAQKIFDMTGVTPTVMRPPGGAWDNIVQETAKAAGVSIVLWSVDPRDWASHNASAVLQTMAKKARDGDVILMHDMSNSSVKAALRLVDALQEKGYCFVTVSELAQLTGTTLEPGGVYKHFRTAAAWEFSLTRKKGFPFGWFI